MKISPVSKVNFTYNKQYHEKLHEDLTKVKHDKELARFLIDSDKISLAVEDEINLMEKDHKKCSTNRFDTLVDYLADLKRLISFYMSDCFSKFEYAENLLGNYVDEANLETKDVSRAWRMKLVESIIGNTNPITDPDAEAEKENLKDDILKTVNDVQKQAVDEYKDKQAKELLEQFEPTMTSPKGFSDVIGIEEVKLKLKENIVDYAQNPEQALKDYTEYGISAPRGFLFYGPPGCGKTYITKALAAESGLDMYKLDVSKAGSKYVNQTSKNIQQAFDVLKDKAAAQGKPILLFMDEVDSLAMSRGDVMKSDENMKTVTTLLKLVETARDNNIIIIAATNKYDLLDEAFKARFDGQVYFPLPKEEEIESLLKYLLNNRKKGVKLANSDDRIKKLASMFKGHSNRSITFIVDEASKLAKRRNRANISFDDVKKALETTELEKSKERDYKKASKARIVGFK